MSIAPGTRIRYVCPREEHLAEIMKIEREAYPEPWTVGMFREEMRSKRSYFFVAFVEGEIIGYSGLWLVLDEAHVTSLTVRKSHRGLGYGREQLLHLFEVGADKDVGTFTLEVRESNESARKLYESEGFRAVGVRKEYYSTTQEDAIVMLREES